MAMEEEFLRRRLPSGKPCIVQVLADDHIMFLPPNRENISKTRDVWELFSNASGLRINMHKSVLISCTEQDMLGLGWSGRIVHGGMICRHLRYPIGVEVSHMKLIEWVSERLEDKLIYTLRSYWRSQFGLFMHDLRWSNQLWSLWCLIIFLCSHGQRNLLKCCHTQCECCYGKEKGKVPSCGWHEIMFVLRSVLMGHRC